ncbi:hypothetical protein TI03_02235 [Achromatium sp. WMS1]|nr:hypothetical protein TI03_02235 [Achromatium sp. WMS1]
MITGLSGLGKLDFAYHIAHSLLCINPDVITGYPCGQCKSCHIFEVGNHPNLQFVGPEMGSKNGEIKAETIRTLIEFDTLAAQFRGYKVIIIAPADSMNRHAANSLLKILEEPTPATIMLLVTAHPGRLLPTIRSRCQQLPINVPREQDALSWLVTQTTTQRNLSLALRLANGAPLASLAYNNENLLQQRRAALEAFFKFGNDKQNPIFIAERWVQQDPCQILTWLSSWLADLLRLKSTAAPVFLDNPDITQFLYDQSAKYDSVTIHLFWSKVIESRKQLSTNVNPQLLIESLLITWNQMQHGNAGY